MNICHSHPALPRSWGYSKTAWPFSKSLKIVTRTFFIDGLKACVECVKAIVGTEEVYFADEAFFPTRNHPTPASSGRSTTQKEKGIPRMTQLVLYALLRYNLGGSWHGPGKRDRTLSEKS